MGEKLVIIVTIEELLSAAGYVAYLSPQTLLTKAKRLAATRGLDLRRPYSWENRGGWLHGEVEFSQDVVHSVS